MNAPAERTPKNLDDLRQEIKQTRAELGETVEALAAKLDVKARLEGLIAETELTQTFVNTHADAAYDHVSGSQFEDAVLQVDVSPT